MNKYEIGNNAGILWRLMVDNYCWTVKELVEKSGLTMPEVYLAIGWLARENQVEFDSSHSELRIYLHHHYY
ncbi:MAG: winged helix-turn-helix domain-containing protein [Parabacteroides sp.]|nr:winged helix-turn-helix domain-containing protein [Parabacteroides sp.]